MKIFNEIKFDVDTTPYLSVDWEQHKCSCIQHHLTEQADLHENEGFPDSLCMENTTIYQKFFTEDEIDFKELENQLGLEVITVSTIMQKPGNIIPWHRDIFYQITKKFPNRKEEKVRANMFLTDWENGQFLQFDDEVITNWKKNTGYIFNDQVLHLSSNAGLKNKVTLQVSGFY